jgi:hypothetical protein
MRASFALLAPLALATLLLPTAPATTAELPTTGTAVARYTGHDVAVLTASSRSPIP